MKIKWKISLSGTVYNRDGGVKPGDVMEVDDAEAERVIALGQAEEVKPGRKSVEHAVADLSTEERAVLDTGFIGASDKVIPQPRAPRPPKAEPEPEVAVEPEPKPAKRGPGRPRKT